MKTIDLKGVEDWREYDFAGRVYRVTAPVSVSLREGGEYGIRRIKGVTVTTLVNGRGVDVVFRSPYRWRIYEGDRDVTKSFGHRLVGETLPGHSAEWEAFHAETKANEINCVLHAV